jgi:hypothetical protein
MAGDGWRGGWASNDELQKEHEPKGLKANVKNVINTWGKVCLCSLNVPSVSSTLLGTCMNNKEYEQVYT